jgi:hypothetical protein
VGFSESGVPANDLIQRDDQYFAGFALADWYDARSAVLGLDQSRDRTIARAGVYEFELSTPTNSHNVLLQEINEFDISFNAQYGTIIIL